MIGSTQEEMWSLGSGGWVCGELVGWGGCKCGGECGGGKFRSVGWVGVGSG